MSRVVLVTGVSRHLGSRMARILSHDPAIDRVVGVEVAHAFGDRLGRERLEDLLADRIVDLGQSGEVEVATEQRDQPGALVTVERLEGFLHQRLARFHHPAFCRRFFLYG